ncbi:MAG: protein-glutamate O-methyltransferase CheR [Chitinophagaceae bacterium]
MIKAISEEAINLLLNVLFERYGYDFMGYSRASVRRRIMRLIDLDKFSGIDTLIQRVQYDAVYARRFIEELTVNVTEMFRDASFFHCLRNKILPLLNTYPLIRIWHAGCSTGEEVYSMAILLQEENLYHKSLLYATDINPGVIEKAKKGIFSLSQMQAYSSNYIAAGGKYELSRYYTANYGAAKFDSALTDKIIFATHNLVSDTSFNAFQLIICRNVLIYFDKDLQEIVFNLFDDSLDSFGFLALGAKETLRFSNIANRYKQIDKEKIWRKG